MEEKLNQAIDTLNSILSSLPPVGIDEKEEIKEKLKEIENISHTIFCKFNKECIEFSQLNHIKKQLSQVSFLVVRCLSLVEYLEYSHSKLCNQQSLDKK